MGICPASPLQHSTAQHSENTVIIDLSLGWTAQPINGSLSLPRIVRQRRNSLCVQRGFRGGGVNARLISVLTQIISLISRFEIGLKGLMPQTFFFPGWHWGKKKTFSGISVIIPHRDESEELVRGWASRDSSDQNTSQPSVTHPHSLTLRLQKKTY